MPTAVKESALFWNMACNDKYLAEKNVPRGEATNKERKTVLYSKTEALERAQCFLFR